MSFTICSLASSSSGNCYLIRSENTALLVDAGISAKQIKSSLEMLGMSIEDIFAVVVTHEHSDHIKGLRTLMKSYGIPVMASLGTAKAMERLGIAGCRAFSSGDAFSAGDIGVKSCRSSHDAEDPVCYSFSSGGRCISVVTDTGIITRGMAECIKASDILVLESNHDVNILRMGRYPWFLKQRILSDKGHLSNETAAETLGRILCEEAQCGCIKKRIVLLAHLSKENNFPEMALATMENTLLEMGVVPGKETLIKVLDRTEMSCTFGI